MSIPQIVKIPMQKNTLFSTKFTMLDIQAEMLLSFVGKLLEDYYRLGATVKDERFNTIACIQTKNIVDTLYTYIATNVINFHDVKELISQPRENNKHKILLVKNRESIAVYLNFMLKVYSKYFKDGDQYIPDLLAIWIIYHFKTENNKCFLHHPFIQNFDLFEYLQYSEDINLELKKKINKIKKEKRIWHQRTILDKMSMIAEAIVKDYLASEYKVTKIRISKRNKNP